MEKLNLKISKKELNNQLELLRKGTQFVTLIRSCVRGIGIGLFSDNEIDGYLAKYEKAVRNGKTVIKFVPASGAASRMFKHLYNVENPNGSAALVNQFFCEIKSLPFYNDLSEKLTAEKMELNKLLEEKSYHVIADKILSPKGLNYGDVPKGMVKFHNYKNKSRTAFEEHLIESINYCKNRNNEINIHFTITEKYTSLIDEHIKKAKKKIENEFNVVFNISYSYQDPSTDTIAVDLVNNPLKDENGNMIFRPGGHGSLLKNLNELDADLIFVKNIDNVSLESDNENNNKYKKAIAGRLIELQNNVFYALEKLKINQVDARRLNVIQQFLEVRFQHVFPDNFKKIQPSDRIEYLINVLNRPIRVCGMVKNEGEPGGGPFVIENENGKSLQIVESSQVNLNDKDQAKIWNSSTYFNPVDIVCGTKDYKGNKFDLTKFTDPSTVFISKKSSNGVELKALEWPGLWNGSMADWLTAFVEVPSSTFNPVKTVNDLLKKEHQVSILTEKAI